MTASDTTSTPTHYRLKFLPEALAEWNALDGSVKEVLKKLLKGSLCFRLCFRDGGRWR